MRKRLTLEYLKLNKMKKTILIVDDEKDIVDLLSYNLSNQNYNIITAADGASALLKVNSQIDDTSKISQLKKDLAKVMTNLNKKKKI